MRIDPNVDESHQSKWQAHGRRLWLPSCSEPVQHTLEYLPQRDKLREVHMKYLYTQYSTTGENTVKGQIMSEAIFLGFNSSKKWTKYLPNPALANGIEKSLVRFLEEFGTRKVASEVIWPFSVPCPCIFSCVKRCNYNMKSKFVFFDTAKINIMFLLLYNGGTP